MRQQSQQGSTVDRLLNTLLQPASLFALYTCCIVSDSLRDSSISSFYPRHHLSVRQTGFGLGR